MAKKRVRIRDKKLKELLAQGGRKGAKGDFLELIKRSVKKSS